MRLVAICALALLASGCVDFEESDVRILREQGEPAVATFDWTGLYSSETGPADVGEAEVNAPVHANGSVSDLRNLRPKLFLEGLFVDIRPYLNKPDVKFSDEEEFDGKHSYYVLTVFDSRAEAPYAEVSDRIWIDRFDLQVARKQVFGGNGVLQTDVRYQNYQNAGGISFPQEILILRKVERLTVKITFQMDALKLNVHVNPIAWDLPRPEGAETIDLIQP